MKAGVADSTGQALLFSGVVESYASALKQLVESKTNPKTTGGNDAACVQVLVSSSLHCSEFALDAAETFSSTTKIIAS